MFSPRSHGPAEKIEGGVGMVRGTYRGQRVLITGGDPALLPNTQFRSILTRLASIPTSNGCALAPGSRGPAPEDGLRLPGCSGRGARPTQAGFALVTHFEHPYEVTPEAATAVRSLRSLGISIYNHSLHHGELPAFRDGGLALHAEGDRDRPLLHLNAKGKEETSSTECPSPGCCRSARRRPGCSRIK